MRRFFKRLFKRKRGGTFFGNLIRKVASHYTYGILGQGVGLNNYWSRIDAQQK